LHQEDEALEAYARGLELEDRLKHMVSRRNVLTGVDAFVNRVIKRQPDNAKAHAVLALLRLAEQKYPAAAAAAERSLAIDPRQARALAVSGTVHLVQATRAEDPAGKQVELRKALDLFQRALKGAPGNRLAAAGRARVYEELGEPEKALEAFNSLLAPSHPGGVPLAVTPGQQAEALQGRYRALIRLGREDEARRALQEARRIDPAASAARGR
jgi:tetratricopeptide (TPR) repeat protein